VCRKVKHAGAITANRLANKALLDQATNDLDCSSNDSRDDNELVECQLLEGEHSLSSTLISEPIASEPVASEPVASESIKSTKLRKRTQAAVEVEDEPVIWVSQRKRQKRAL
jgi:hypothetical protein